MIRTDGFALAAIAGFTEVRPCSPRESAAYATGVSPAIGLRSPCAALASAYLSGREEKRGNGPVPPEPLAEGGM